MDAGLKGVDALAQEVQKRMPPGAEPRHLLEVISDVLFRQEMFRGTLALDNPKSLSLSAVLKDKAGTCVSLVILYLAVAERVGVRVKAAATPVHLFVRYEGPGGPLNVETLEQGRFLDDATYRRRNRMDNESVQRGIFMTLLPDSAVLAHFLSNRAVIYSKAGEHRKALKDFEQALKLYPDLVAAYYNRGLEYLRRGKFEKARADFSEAIDRHPLDAQAFNNRGLANLKLGDREAAKRDFEEALKIAPGLKEAAQNLRLLQQPEPAAP
jgi:regulator of sirC expression with transglutaminase-like and TPR domain